MRGEQWIAHSVSHTSKMFWSVMVLYGAEGATPPATAQRLIGENISLRTQRIN